MFQSLWPYIKLMRPKQWIKNLFVITPLIFGMKLLEIDAVMHALLCMLIFCLAASAVYVFNDILDKPSDKEHPENYCRPLAAEVISIPHAFIFLAFLLLCTLILGYLSVYLWQMPIQVYVCLLAYFLINLGYSLGLKHWSLVEMFLVSSGYILRVIAGCIAIDLIPSPWILVATGVVALLIIAGKRRAELISMDVKKHKRKVMDGYNLPFLDALISIFGGAAMMTYMIFSVSDYAMHKFQTQNLILTSIFVVFGVARYIQLIKDYGGRQDPTDLIVSEPGMCLAVLFWVISVVLIIYV